MLSPYSSLCLRPSLPDSVQSSSSAPFERVIWRNELPCFGPGADCRNPQHDVGRRAQVLEPWRSRYQPAPRLHPSVCGSGLLDCCLVILRLRPGPQPERHARRHRHPAVLPAAMSVQLQCARPLLPPPPLSPSSRAYTSLERVEIGSPTTSQSATVASASRRCVCPPASWLPSSHSSALSGSGSPTSTTCIGPCQRSGLGSPQWGAKWAQRWA